jgi:hypothetical protein
MPKFTLSDLFAVVTIVALALGWLDRWRDERKRRRPASIVYDRNARRDDVVPQQSGVHFTRIGQVSLQ